MARFVVTLKSIGTDRLAPGSAVAVAVYTYRRPPIDKQGRHRIAFWARNRRPSRHNAKGPSRVPADIENLDITHGRPPVNQGSRKRG